MNRKIIRLTASLLISLSTYAEGGLKHEYSLYGGGGLSTLLYRPASGTQSNGFGGLAGLGYTLFFNDLLGVGLGAEVAFYNAKVKVPPGSFTSKMQAVDIDKTSFDFIGEVNNYEESQRATYLNIPLMLYIQSKNYHRVYGALGAKFGIPLGGIKGNYKGTVTTSGYYAEENTVPPYNEQDFMGFGCALENGNNNLKINLAYLLSAEVGMKWTLNRDLVLYTGVYFDYGLNDIRKKNEPFLAYNADKPKEIGTNGLLNAQYEYEMGNEYEMGKYKNFTDKVSPLAAGIKLRLAFGKGIGQTKNVAEKPAAPVDTVPKTDSVPRPRKYQLSDDDEAEREAYLKDAKERKKKYRQTLGDVNNYGLAIVTLNSVQKRTLDQYIERLKLKPEISLNIIGHTCDIGSDQLNLRIGQERADLAKDYMVENGIAPRRIRTFSRGKFEPLVPNINEANRKKNRRLEIQEMRPEREDRDDDRDE